MAMHFYTRAMPRCDTCRKPATKEVLGSGNAHYGYACDRCAAKRVKELTRAHNANEAESR